MNNEHPKSVPPGWKLVPIEPTHEMLAATSWPGCAATDYRHMLAAAPPPPKVAGLTFEDALRIAHGCTDYGGGYRSDPEQYEAYQAGIQTVIAALTSAARKGFGDTQIAALHAMGANTYGDNDAERTAD